MSEIHAVTVYCSSSRKVDRTYLQAASELGQAIAQTGWKLVYGGNHIGCMAALADGARDGGAKVIGVTPQILVDKGLADIHCDELIVTPDLRQRKAIMEQRGDAFIACPGGIGTWEEIFEILVGRSLGCHCKPIVLMNVNDFYGPMLQMMQQGLEQRFIREGTERLWHIARGATDAINYLKSHAVAQPPAPSGQAANPAME